MHGIVQSKNVFMRCIIMDENHNNVCIHVRDKCTRNRIEVEEVHFDTIYISKHDDNNKNCNA